MKEFESVNQVNWRLSLRKGSEDLLNQDPKKVRKEIGKQKPIEESNILRKLQFVPLRDDGISNLSAIVTLKERSVSQVSFKHPRIEEKDWKKTQKFYDEIKKQRREESLFSPGLRSQNSQQNSDLGILRKSVEQIRQPKLNSAQLLLPVRLKKPAKTSNQPSKKIVTVGDTDFNHRKWAAYQEVVANDGESLRKTLLGASLEELGEVKVTGKNKLMMEMDFCERVPPQRRLLVDTRPTDHFKYGPTPEGEEMLAQHWDRCSAYL